MKELVFLLEEESAKAMLETLLPRLLKPTTAIHPRFVVFEGKQHLEKQLVKRLSGYVNPLARFIVLRDQDKTPDCNVVKSKLLGLCAQAGRESSALVRIACHELESFYLADLQAVELALKLTGLAPQQNKARFRSTDHVEKPSKELARLTQNQYQKVSSSRQLGSHLNLTNERSKSFKNLICAIQRFEEQLLNLPNVVS
jgi:hypothetical protein